MSIYRFLRLLALAISVFVFASAGQYGNVDGNMLPGVLGKGAQSPEVQSLETRYHCEMVNEAHWLTYADGIELIMKDGMLDEIRLYRNSSAYGSFKGELPKSLRFAMAQSEVRAVLGKPVTAYNNFLDFSIQGVDYACGFEGGKLTLLTISRM